MANQNEQKKEKTTMDLQSRILSPDDFGLKEDAAPELSPNGLAECVRVLRQNWRQGTVACKGRSDVAFSNKKPWRQKGTGRARAGSLRSPIWRKGGASFGPQPRVRTLKVPKGLRKGVLGGIFWERLSQGKIAELNSTFDGEKPKTAKAFGLLKEAGVHTLKVSLFVSEHDYQAQASFANIPNVKIYLFDQPNAYSLAYGDCWVYLKKDENLFKQMVEPWI